MVEIKTDTKLKLKKPSKYSVILLNDDYSTYDFVITTLINIFNKSVVEANILTELIHNNGFGIVGIYDKQIAESKVNEVFEFSKLNKMPLTAKIKKN